MGSIRIHSFLPAFLLAGLSLALAIGCAKTRPEVAPADVPQELLSEWPFNMESGQNGGDASVLAEIPSVLDDDASVSNEILLDVEDMVTVASIDNENPGYRLRPGDQLDVLVYREAELSGSFRLDPSGVIRHPLLGTIELAGLSQEESEARLTKILSEDYLVNPRVMVKIISAQSSQVVLFGEVKKPGVYPIPFGETLTLLQAIAGAGGFTELASLDRVRIVRTVDGQQETIRVKVSGLLSGKGGERDIPLEPNDVIMVPQVVF